MVSDQARLPIELVLNCLGGQNMEEKYRGKHTQFFLWAYHNFAQNCTNARSIFCPFRKSLAAPGAPLAPAVGGNRSAIQTT